MTTTVLPLQSKSVTIAPQIVPFDATFPIVTPLTLDTSKGSQTIHGRLNSKFIAQSQEYFDNTVTAGRRVKRMIAVDLNGSSYGAPSTNMLDQDDMRGFYVEKIRYRIWLQTPGAAADFNSPAPDWVICKEAPDTSNATGSISSSINWGFNASAGVFGDMPTANVGGNFGVSNSNSHTLTDFTFYQLSDSSRLDHNILMSQTGDGNPYKDTNDLFNQWQSPFVGVRLRPITSLAKSNVPLVGQAVWMNETDAGLVDQLVVNIEVKPHWVLIEASFDGSFHKALDVVEPDLTFQQAIDFTMLT